MSDITTDSFNLQLQLFQQQLVSSVGKNTIVIYTIPADNYTREAHVVRKKVKGRWRTKRVVAYENNAKLIALKNTLIDFCNSNNIMYWDLFEVMGGYGSMRNWVRSGYAAPDHVHFSKGGYELQGDLFFQALQRVLTNP
jgi:lysophospholipase L1-like esterase